MPPEPDKIEALKRCHTKIIATSTVTTTTTKSGHNTHIVLFKTDPLEAPAWFRVALTQKNVGALTLLL